MSHTLQALRSLRLFLLLVLELIEKDSQKAGRVKALTMTKAKLLVMSELLDEVNPALHGEEVKPIKELDEGVWL